MLLLFVALPAAASGVRDNTRLVRRDGATISAAQASELTLTLTEVAPRPIQSWVRVAGVLNGNGRVLTAALRPADARRVQVGQRLRAFSLDRRTLMHQGRITRVRLDKDGASVEATLADQPGGPAARYLMEIVTEQGPFLSVPNVSIIEEGDRHVVYVQQSSGQYASRVIETGVQGELYTQVTAGLKAGDQVVSIGSFFVDADVKLKYGSSGTH